LIRPSLLRPVKVNFKFALNFKNILQTGSPGFSPLTTSARPDPFSVIASPAPSGVAISLGNAEHAETTKSNWHGLHGFHGEAEYRRQETVGAAPISSSKCRVLWGQNAKPRTERIAHGFHGLAHEGAGDQSMG
jgi:hypothetical protein